MLSVFVFPVNKDYQINAVLLYRCLPGECVNLLKTRRWLVPRQMCTAAHSNSKMF